VIGSAAATCFHSSGICGTDSAIGHRGRLDREAARGLRGDSDFICLLRSASTTGSDLYGEGIGSCGLRRSGEIQRRRCAGCSRGYASRQRAGCDRPLIGSAAAAGPYRRRICAADSVIG
jgi:hypothetical protein